MLYTGAVSTSNPDQQYYWSYVVKQNFIKHILYVILDQLDISINEKYRAREMPAVTRMPQPTLHTST